MGNLERVRRHTGSIPVEMILSNDSWIDRRKNSKSLAWSSVLKAFEKTEGKPVVSRPKALEDIRGVSYLYGIFYKFVRFLTDTTLKTEDDIRKNLHMPVLSVIPYYEGKKE